MPNTTLVCNSSSKVLVCTCAHEYQDRVYGRGNRLCNPTAKQAGKDRINTYRCTVCGKHLDA